MNVRGFCDAAYSVVLEEYLRPVTVRGRQYAGMRLNDALNRLEEWAASVTASEEAHERELTARQNDRALMQINAMLGVA